MSQLRRALEPERLPHGTDALLVNRPAGYMLAIEPEQIDVHRLETLAQEGRRPLPAADQQTRHRLVEALGLEPGPELQNLLTRILDQDPALELDTPSVPVARQRTHDLPLQLTSFVGCQQDLDGSKEALGERRLLTLVGAA